MRSSTVGDMPSNCGGGGGEDERCPRTAVSEWWGYPRTVYIKELMQRDQNIDCGHEGSRFARPVLPVQHNRDISESDSNPRNEQHSRHD
jgi:hypothetical protein